MFLHCIHCITSNANVLKFHTLTSDFRDETIYPDHITEARNALYGPRTDGMNYTWPKNIVPYRIYVGIKGKLEDGSDAPADDFLARNGLKYGQIYGFAVDMASNTTAPYDLWRDEFHKTASNGDKVEGKWLPQEWRWDGEVKNFQHDGSWDYQNKPPNTGEGSGMEGFEVRMLLTPRFNSCFISNI